jgi:uncharacterized protein YjiS (DUF1127 family)
MEVSMSVVPMAREFQVPQERSLPARVVHRLFGLTARVVIWIGRELAVRRDMRRLAEFDDHMLHDIGIARADIEGSVRRGHDGSGEGPDSHQPNAAPKLIVLPGQSCRF